MATREPFCTTRVYREYTMSEAIEYMKMLDRYATDTSRTITWKSVKTGKQVHFGYT